MIMATYNESLGGYVADVPRVVFRRCDKRAIYLDELSSATVTANIETTDINGGWSLFPVAVLPGSSTFTMNFTSAKFESELFSITNKTNFVKNSNYQLPTGERHEIDANHQITLLNTPVAGTVYIRGMEETTEQTVATGTYKVDAETKKITFSADDDMDYVDVVYEYVKEVQEAIITNKESAIGEATAIWPVYGSGDDCTESDIIGYWVVKVFRARVTTLPGMDTSYKSAATFTYELTALDAKRNDEGAYSTAYFKK